MVLVNILFSIYSIHLIFVYILIADRTAQAKQQLTNTLHRTDEFEKSLEIHEEGNINPSWLEYFLRPFIGNQCFVILRNFLNLDFTQTSVPLLTQYFEPMIETGGLYKRCCVIWVACKPHSKCWFNETLDALENKSCDSRYLLKYGVEIEWTSSCVALNVTKWVVSNRPGPCKIIIDYALPEYFYIGEESKYSDCYPYSEYTLSHWSPLSLQINVLVQVIAGTVHSEKESSIEGSLSVWPKLSRVQLADRRRPTVSVFYLITVKSAALDGFHHDVLMHTIYQINHLTIQKLLVTSQDWNQMKLADVKSIQQTGINEKFRIGSIFKQHLGKSLKSCSSYARIRPGHGIATIEDRIARKADADTHILQLIIGNFTYNLENNSMCISPGVILQNPSQEGHKIEGYELTGNEIFEIYDFKTEPTIVFNSSHRDIRFVTCCDRGNSQLEFKQLLSVFDFNIWVSLSITCFVVIVILSQMQMTESWKEYENTATQIFKTFVEQGDPFSVSLISNPRLRFIICSLILAGIVLSNAYKSQNVYLMTQPRQALLYDNVKQLLFENFTLYSRLGLAAHPLIAEANSIFIVLDVWTSPYFENYDMSLGTPTYEVKKLNAWIYTALESIMYGTHKFVTDEEHKQEIRPPPHAYEELGKLYDDFFLNVDMGHYIKWEQEILLDLLRSQNRLAVFLPEAIAVKYVSKLQNEGSHKRCTISKQGFHKEPVGIKIGGIITRAIGERVARITQSGILSKWQTLFDFDLQKETRSQREEISAVELSGNIFILFTLLMVGYSVACAALVLEALSHL